MIYKDVVVSVPFGMSDDTLDLRVQTRFLSSFYSRQTCVSRLLLFNFNQKSGKTRVFKFLSGSSVLCNEERILKRTEIKSECQRTPMGFFR